MDSNNASVNNKTVTEAPVSITDLAIQYMYIGFALAALIANLIIVVVLIRNRDYLRKSAFTLGLCLGDIVLAVGTIMAGVARSGYLNLHLQLTTVHPFKCLQSFTTLLIVGVQLPSAMIFLIGIERLLAVALFQWYYTKWSEKKAWYLTCVGYVYCSISLAVVWYIVGCLPDNVFVNIFCGTPPVVQPTYATYHFGFAVASGCFSIAATVVSLMSLRIKRSRFQNKVSFNNNNSTSIKGHPTNNNITNAIGQDMKKYLKSQWKLTESAICLALCDVVLVVIPNIMLTVTTYFSASFGPMLGASATCMLCVRSTITIFIYLKFNREFKVNLKKTFNCGYVSNTANTLMTTNVTKTRF